ncbi:MAG: glutamate--tRNA ligase family protein [Eggerthella lenta]
MHAGNVFAALTAWLVAKSQGGRIVLRIEDLDAERSKPVYIDAVQRDFEALGLTWDEGPYFQHDRTEAYRAAYDELRERGLVYPCFCTRADLHAASAPHRGEKPVYPGTCRHLSDGERAVRAQQRMPAQRLIVPDREVAFVDQVQGPYAQNLAADCGDFLVQRSDGAFAYQLAVVVDDAAQGVTSVVRGVDLLCSTPQQLYLQELSVCHPVYAHIPLLVAERDRRLSKRPRRCPRCTARALQDARSRHRPYRRHHRPAHMRPCNARRAAGDVRSRRAADDLDDPCKCVGGKPTGVPAAATPLPWAQNGTHDIFLRLSTRKSYIEKFAIRGFGRRRTRTARANCHGCRFAPTTANRSPTPCFLS